MTTCLCRSAGMLYDRQGTSDNNNNKRQRGKILLRAAKVPQNNADVTDDTDKGTITNIGG